MDEVASDHDGRNERDRVFLSVPWFHPAIALGIMSLLVLAVAIFARYPRQLAGHWCWVYVLFALLGIIAAMRFRPEPVRVLN